MFEYSGGIVRRWFAGKSSGAFNCRQRLGVVRGQDASVAHPPRIARIIRSQSKKTTKKKLDQKAHYGSE